MLWGGKKPFSARHEKGIETLANETATISSSPYSPHRMSFKGFSILFGPFTSVKREYLLICNESEPVVSFGHDGRTKTIMNINALTTMIQLKEFLAGTQPATLSILSPKDEGYQWIHLSSYFEDRRASIQQTTATERPRAIGLT